MEPEADLIEGTANCVLPILLLGAEGFRGEYVLRRHLCCRRCRCRCVHFVVLVLALLVIGEIDWRKVARVRVPVVERVLLWVVGTTHAAVETAVHLVVDVPGRLRVDDCASAHIIVVMVDHRGPTRIVQMAHAIQEGAAVQLLLRCPAAVAIRCLLHLLIASLLLLEVREVDVQGSLEEFDHGLVVFQTLGEV